MPEIHAAAFAVARLGAPFSLLDQEWAARGINNLLNLSLVVGYILGYYLGSFKYTVMSIGFAMLVCHILFLPNWRQRHDPTLQWVPRKQVDEYYQLLERCKDVVEPQTKGSRKPIRPPDAPKAESK
jgi:hypothetical protein